MVVTVTYMHEKLPRSNTMANHPPVRTLVRMASVPAPTRRTNLFFGAPPKVYQGTSVFAEHALLEEPSGLCALHGLGDNAVRPGVGVAAGPYIFIYK